MDLRFQARGLQVHRTMQNLVCRDDAGQYRAQVDLLVVNGDTAIAVECKSNLAVADVDEHLDRLARFKDGWPEYAGYRLLGTHPLAQPSRPLARPDSPLARLRPRPAWSWLWVPIRPPWGNGQGQTALAATHRAASSASANHASPSRTRPPGSLLTGRSSRRPAVQALGAGTGTSWRREPRRGLVTADMTLFGHFALVSHTK